MQMHTPDTRNKAYKYEGMDVVFAHLVASPRYPKTAIALTAYTYNALALWLLDVDNFEQAASCLVMRRIIPNLRAGSMGARVH